jgi:hypothetical protein
MENELQLLGSSISIHYRGRFIVLATRHQLINLGVDESEVSQVGQLLLNDSKMVTSSGFFRYGTKELYNSDDRYDIVAFFFDEQVKVYKELASRFFDFKRPWKVDGDDLIESFVVGCAYSDQIVDFSEERHLHVVRRNHSCAYVGPSKTDGLDEVQDLTGDSFNPDGMSGGGVFHIRNDAFGSVVEFGGVIQRGGNSRYHYINASQVALFMDSAIHGYQSSAA